MKTLADRIRWILEKRDLGQRELARAAGLKDPHVAVILHRLEKFPDRKIEADTLAALARAGRVSMRWLATGEGSPDDAGDVPAPESDEPTCGNAPGWPDAERDARKEHPDMPPWAFERARRRRNLTTPNPVTPEFVYEQALSEWRWTPQQEQAALERKRIEASAKALRTRYENTLKKGRKAPKKKDR